MMSHVLSQDDDDDAALIDSFFLPGGILDPDDEDEDEESLTRLSCSRPLAMSRVPSNPWRNEAIVEQPKSYTEESSKDSFLLDSSIHTGASFGHTPLVLPPPGYTNYPETIVGLEATNHVIAPTPTQHTIDDYNPNNSSHTQSSPSSPGPVNCVPPGFQDKTIRRPCHHMSNMAHEISIPSQVVGGNPVEDMNRQAFAETSDTALQVLRIPRLSLNKQTTLQTNPFMAFLDTDSGDDTSEDENLTFDLLKKSISEREAATNMEGSELEITQEEENDDDGEDDDLDESMDEEDSPFPIEMFAFVSDSAHLDSTISSLSSSSSSSSEPDGTCHDYDKEQEQFIGDKEIMEEATLALDSAVAVILEITDSKGKSYMAEQNDRREKELSISEPAKCSEENSTTVDPIMTQAAEAAAEKVSTATFPFSNDGTESTHSSRMASIPGLRQDGKTSAFTKIKNWSNNFQDYKSYMEDFCEVIGAFVEKAWISLILSMTLANKLFTIASMFLFQTWKFALIEAIEEPPVAISFAVFYLMPSFCCLLRDLFSIPHWTPHFITSVAVWCLCSQIPAGPLHLENISIFEIFSFLLKRHIVLSTETRPRDERACRTILRILRFVLPVFFFVDGFSTEFGTIMGVSGSSRLTTAYMMSLVRKSLVSSPIGWVSWAVQVLLATHHPSSYLVDFLVLISGLSSIRLIRYLELRRAGNKKRDGKEH